MKVKMIAAAAVIALSVGACNGGPKTTIGGLGGAAAGGLIASQVGGGAAGIAAGVILGGLIGGAIGNALDQRDQELALQAQQQAYYAPIGQPVQWQNPQNGHYGTITPVNEGYSNTTGQYCREFQQTIVVGGQPQQAYGVACQRPDGSWEIQ